MATLMVYIVGVLAWSAYIITCVCLI